MRAAAIYGPAASAKDLAAFQCAGVEFTDSIPGADAAVVFGGDGTVHRFLPQVYEHKVPLLAVPAGSGNDFHREIGTGTRALAAEAWQAFVQGKPPREIDLGEFHNVEGERRVFCCVAGFGLDSDANLRANALPSWLKRNGGYIIAALQTIFTYKPKRVRLTAGGKTLDEPVTMVAIGNAPAYGSGLRITPRALFDDGKLDVCFVRALSKPQLLRFFPKVFRGSHVELEQVEYLQAADIRIETDVPMRINCDGEHGGHTPAVFTVLPKALRVIVP